MKHTINYTIAGLIVYLCSAASVSAQGKCGNVYSKHRNSLVSLTITVQNDDTGVIGTSHGTGFIITEDGYVLTAAHLLPSMEGFKIRTIVGAIGDLSATPNEMEMVDSNKHDISLFRFKNSAQRYEAVPLGKSQLIKDPIVLCSLGFIGPNVQDYHYSSGSWTGMSSTSWTSNIDSRKGESGSPIFSDVTGEAVAMKQGTLNSGSNSVASLLTPLHLGSELITLYIGKDISQLGTPPLALSDLSVIYETGSNEKDQSLEVQTEVELDGKIVGRINPEVGVGENWSTGAKRREVIYLTQPLLLSRCKDLKIKVGVIGTHTWSVRFKVQGKLSNNTVINVLPDTQYYELRDSGSQVTASEYFTCG